MSERVKQILLAAKETLRSDLERAGVHVHPTPKGNATESGWGKFLGDHLPRRYEVTQGFVVDRCGTESDQIDLIICDRHFTTLLLDDEAARYVPAESVYAVFEVKQTLSKEHVKAAQAKLASVRRLQRTSVAIRHAGGTYGPTEPLSILGGLLATRSEWSPAFGDPITSALRGAEPDARLDLVVGLEAGSAEVNYSGAGEPVLEAVTAETAMPWFYLTLVHRLQERGTVAAVDYLQYRRSVVS